MFVHSLECDFLFCLWRKMSYVRTMVGWRSGGQPWVPHCNSTHARLKKLESGQWRSEKWNMGSPHGRPSIFFLQSHQPDSVSCSYPTPETSWSQIRKDGYNLSVHTCTHTHTHDQHSSSRVVYATHIVSWRLRCRDRWSEREKLRLQSVHRKGLMPVCLRKWRVSSSERANFQEQPSQVHL